MCERYLTESEKAAVIASWETQCSNLPDDMPSCGDERGYPDPPMIQWCRIINQLPGICTIQSCAGHRRADGTLNSGHLWVRLSRDMSARFDEIAMSLAAQPGIEQVSRLYTRWGAEVVSLVFLGNERGHLERSMQTVVQSLTALARSCGTSRSPLSSGIRYRVRPMSALCS